MLEVFETTVTAKSLYAFLLCFCWDCNRGKTRYECGHAVCCAMTMLASDMILKGEY